MKTKISRFSVLSLAVVAMLVTINVQFTDPADAYEHILTIQNAADLEFPASGPVNAPARRAAAASEHHAGQLVIHDRGVAFGNGGRF